jgi:hypothetical protein
MKIPRTLWRTLGLGPKGPVEKLHFNLLEKEYISDHCCSEMKKHVEAGEVALRYVPKFQEYGILYLDGGTSFQEIKFCPWCAKKLPDSMRDQWIGQRPAD